MRASGCDILCVLYRLLDYSYPGTGTVYGLENALFCHIGLCLLRETTIEIYEVRRNSNRRPESF